MSKLDILRNKVVETVQKINDEATLSAMLIFASTATGQLTTAPAPVPKSPKAKKPRKITPKSEKVSDKLLIVRYEFKNKPMIAVQTVGGKPDESILEKFRSLSSERKLRFYRNAPNNPFPGTNPFWAGPYDEAVVEAFPHAKMMAGA
jgi:hypothetical protein